MKFKKLAILSVLIAILASAAFGLHLLLNDRSPFPKTVQSQVNFPLYYPSKLPTGYKYDKNSLSVKQNVVLYSLRNQQGQAIILTFQAVPANFDFESFYKTVMLGTKELDTPLGIAHIGRLRGQPTGSLILGGKTWLLVTSPDSLSDKLIRPILDSLKPV